MTLCTDDSVRNSLFARPELRGATEKAQVVDSIAQFGVFVRVAEARSFVAAGRQLGISASGVGKAVARLEGRLGVRLFHRSTRSMALTQDGEIFLARCRDILTEIDDAEAELAASRHGPHGRLRVSLPLVGMLLMPTLTRFAKAYPMIELDLDFTDRLVDVIHEGFDVVVRTGEAHDSRLMNRTLGTFGHRLVGAPDYFRRRGILAAPEDVARHACLRHRLPGTGKLAPWPFFRDGRPIPVDVPQTLVAGAIEPIVYLAEQGMGLAYLPDYAVSGSIAAGRLVATLDAHVRHAGVMRALWPASRYPAPKVRAFVDDLAKNLLPQRE